MSKYYLNKDTSSNPNHNNEVHKKGCWRMPSIQNRVDLGEFNNGIEAVNAAKRMGYSKADGCIHCAPEAHKE